MHSSKQVQSAVDEVCREQGGAAYDGESKDPIPSHNPLPMNDDTGHASAEYGGVKGHIYPGGGGGNEPAPGTGGR